MEQMAFAGPSAQDLAGSCYLESFGYRFSGFDSFGASHTILLSILQWVVCENHVGQFGLRQRVSTLHRLGAKFEPVA